MRTVLLVAVLLLTGCGPTQGSDIEVELELEGRIVEATSMGSQQLYAIEIPDEGLLALDTADSGPPVGTANGVTVLVPEGVDTFDELETLAVENGSGLRVLSYNP